MMLMILLGYLLYTKGLHILGRKPLAECEFIINMERLSFDLRQPVLSIFVYVSRTLPTMIVRPMNFKPGVMNRVKL